MSSEIRKKIDTEYFEQILSGQKTYEFRIADFECNSGDTLILDEYAGNDGASSRKPTGRSIRKKVGIVGKTKDNAWLDRPDVKADAEKYGYQIISLLEEDK